MISQNDKNSIERKLKFAGIEKADRKNCGKLKRLLHTLYKAEPLKQKYMFQLVCEKDPYILADAITEMRSNEEALNVLMDYLENWGEDTEHKKETLLAVYFQLHDKESFQDSLRKYIDGDWENHWVERFSEQINNIKDLARALDWISEIEKFPSKSLSCLIFNYNFYQQDIKTGKDALKHLLGKFTEQKRFNCCHPLMKCVGVENYYRFIGLTYDEFVSLFDLWTEQWKESKGNPEISPNLNRISVEIDYCKEAYPHEADNTFVKFRARYKEQRANALRWFYLSFLYEYKLNGRLTEESERDLREIFDFSVSPNIWRKPGVFEQLTECVGVCLEQRNDVTEFLNYFRKINPYDSESIKRDKYFKVKLSPVEKMAQEEKLKNYIKDNDNLKSIIKIYFNTHLKMNLDLTWFYNYLQDQGFTQEEINEEIKDIRFGGWVKYRDAEGTVLFLNNIYMKRGLRFDVSNDKNMRNRLKEGSEVSLYLRLENGHMQIDELLLGNVENGETSIQDQRWSRCIDTIKKVVENGHITIEEELVINKNSGIAVATAKENFEELTDLLLQLSEDADTFKKVLANLRWNSKFRYHSSQERIQEEYPFFVPYTDKCISMIQNLAEQRLNLEDICAIYINTFFRVTISLFDLVFVLVNYFSTEEIVEVLQKYKFAGRKHREGRRVIIENVKGSIYYVTDETNRSRRMYRLCAIERKPTLLVFEIHQNASYHGIIKNQLDEMLEKYRVLSVRPKECDLAYKIIRQVPIEAYESKDFYVKVIEKYFREALYIRRHNAMEIANLIKQLSFHNIYCARKIPIYQNPLVTTFNYQEELAEKAEAIAATIIRNSKSMSQCFFIFINTFLKQYIEVEVFYEMCMGNGMFLKDDFEYSFWAIGSIKPSDTGENVFRPRDIKCKDTVINSEKEIDFDKEYIAGICIKHENQTLSITCGSLKETFKKLKKVNI